MATTYLTDPYARLPELYDLEHDEVWDDVNFYRRVVVAGPVLEIGSGTGRIMRPLLEQGLDVWGVEPSDPMLDRARARLAGFPAAHLVKSSVLDLQLDTRFETCIFSLNALWHLSSAEDQLASLTVAATHLNRGGLLIVDSANPLGLADRRSNGELRERFRWNSGDELVSCDSSCYDDEAHQTLDLHLRYERVASDGVPRVTHTALRLRYVFASELGLMLRIAGFRPTTLFGSYEEDEYVSESPNLIGVAVRH